MGNSVQGLPQLLTGSSWIGLHGLCWGRKAGPPIHHAGKQRPPPLQHRNRTASRAGHNTLHRAPASVTWDVRLFPGHRGLESSLKVLVFPQTRHWPWTAGPGLCIFQVLSPDLQGSATVSSQEIWSQISALHSNQAPLSAGPCAGRGRGDRG